MIPPALIDQLASPGRMFIPVGTYVQNIEQVDKDASGNVTSKQIMGVRVRPCLVISIRGLRNAQYVPLTDRHSQDGHN